MLDPQKKDALRQQLGRKIKKASSNVSTKVEAEKAEYKIVLTADVISQQFEGKEVGRIRVAGLDEDLISYINEDPGDAAHNLLEDFQSSFDVTSYRKSASKKPKTAAHGTQDTETWNMITQKQFDDQKPDLHPRQDEYYTNVTQKQLPEHGQRPGTYDVITQAQLRDERDTFYGSPRTSGDWKQEDRNTVTEDQFEQGVKQYSDVGESDRGEMGAEFDGGAEQQWRQIGEKQLMELLRHHEWTEPLTVTEGADQLAQQDGELSRLTAENAAKIVKEALNALGKTALAVGKSPEELAHILKRLVSHESKLAALGNTLYLFSKSTDPIASQIDKKVALARWGGKTANVANNHSDAFTAALFLTQLSKSENNRKCIVEGLARLAGRDDLINKIDKASSELLENKETEKTAENVFDQVLSEENKRYGTANDGMYSYVGSLSEVNADPNNQRAFAKAAADYAMPKIAADKDVKQDAKLTPCLCDVNKEKEVFEVVFKDENFDKADLEARAEKRKNLAKEANKSTKTAGKSCGECGVDCNDEGVCTNSECKACKASSKQDTKTAQMGGAGGMPPAAGPEMGNPMAPPGGGDMGAPPPGEALGQDPMMDDMEEGPSGEPKPPGSICPVCGGSDVDIDHGEFRCNNCGGEGTISVKFDVNKWPETIIESEDADESGFGLGEDEGLGAEDAVMDEGMEGGGMGEGAGTTMPNVPVGASSKLFMEKVAKTTVFHGTSVKITPLMLNKLAEQKIQMGTVCPNCGGHETSLTKSATQKGHHGICWDCYQEYNFQVKATPNKKHSLFAQHIWAPKSASDCKNCNRNALKTAFVKSLRNYGMSWDHFDKLPSMKEQGDVVVSMAKSQCLDIKEAMQAPLALNRYRPLRKLANRNNPKWDKFENFPSASCIERLARRFGENATAMSGPCKGKVLAECVCKQLETLGTYTDGLAAKVASVQASKDPMEATPVKECVAMFIRNGYEVNDACIACDGLRAAYAEPEEVVIESIAQVNPYLKPMPASPKPMREPGMGRSRAPSEVMDPAGAGQAKPMMAPGGAPQQPGMGGMPGGMPGGMGGGMDPAAAENPALAPKPMMNENPAGGAGMPGAAPGGMPGEMGGSPDGGMGGTPGMPGMDPAKGMDDPMNEPVGVELDISGDMGGDMGMDGGMGDMGDMGGLGDLGDLGGDLGIDGGDTVTLELPQELAGALEQTLELLQNALGGGIGDDMIDTTGDDLMGGDDEALDMGDVTDDTVDGDEDEGSSIPGLVDEDEMGGGDEDESSGNPFGDSDSDSEHMEDTEEKPMCEHGKPMSNKSKSCKPMLAKTETDAKTAALQTAMVKTASLTEQTEVRESPQDLDRLLYSMKSGSTMRSTQSAMDNVFEGLLRQAKLAAKEQPVKKMEYKSATEGDKIKTTPAQDSTDVKFKDGGKIQHEEAFSTGVETKPDVPRAAATIGDEGSEVTVSESGDAPSVPHGSPAMSGEKSYRPEKGNTVDGNQSSQTTSKSNQPIKSAGCNCPVDCNCKADGECDGTCGCKTASRKTASCKKCDGECCDCGSGYCSSHCFACKGKEAQSRNKPKEASKMRKSYTVASTDKYYGAFLKRLNAGKEVVKLEDGNSYLMSQDQSKNIVLIAQNSAEIKKESQTVSPKSVEKLEDDPDINQSSGAGQGKTHVDKAHSLGVDEKKPSEGMDAPSVPEAPDSGQLKREHTYDNKLDGPTVPAGGGSHADYDKNEKNDPEKIEQTLGKENDIAAMASSQDDVTKIAGRMLKANLISIDELPNKIAELSRATPEILKDYEKMLADASAKAGQTQTKGLRTQASTDSIETPFMQKTAGVETDNLQGDIKSLFTLNQRNEDYERFSQDRDIKLYR